MADIELVVKIDENYYHEMQSKNYVVSMSNTCGRAIKNGTPLPKGHGRLIDADDVNNHIIGFVNLSGCPTIIEADKEDK